MDIIVRKAQIGDLAAIMEIYDSARCYMRSCGNMVQWVNGYPQASLLLGDIDRHQLYVMEYKGAVHAAFAFIVGDDPTYEHIDGNWLNHNPYGTVHRLASDGVIRQVLHRCLDFCFTIIGNIRLDTHEQNRKMQSLLAGEGFSCCGIIYIDDGTPRLAFQKQL